MRPRHAPRASLQRLLFVSFAMTILVTTVAVGFAAHLNSGDPQWTRELEQARTFVANRFAQVWDDPAARLELAQGFARDLDLDLVLRNAEGTLLASTGATCSKTPARVQIDREGKKVGSVEICLQRHHRGTWPLFVPFVLAVLVLWGASGLIARRLAAPLRVVAAAADEIGKGKLATRIQLTRHSYREARVLAEIINNMAARIERQLADQRALLAAVSHEIRTPLARLRLITEMGRDKGGDSRTFDELDREVIEVDALVSDLLASSRLDFSVLSRTSLRTQEVATEALKRAGVELSKLQTLEPSLAFEGDPTLIARALGNLIENAKVHGEGVEVLRVGRRDGKVFFEVEDAGPGLEAGEEEKIFQPFYHRVRKEGDEAKSVGLGLALVRRIAEAHGGRAYARNREGGGALVGIESAG